jgi:hypothetical protein
LDTVSSHSLKIQFPTKFPISTKIPSIFPYSIRKEEDNKKGDLIKAGEGVGVTHSGM